MKKPTKYDFRLFALAAAAWGYTCSWAFGVGFWKAIVHTFSIAPSAIASFFGGTVLIMCAISIIAVITHLVVIFSKRNRAAEQVGFLSHVSAFALTWLGIGTLIIISTRPFPYSTSNSDETNRRTSASTTTNQPAPLRVTD